MPEKDPVDNSIHKKYIKQVIVWKLEKDLKAAGFNVLAMSYNTVDYDPPQITIILDETEVKDPTSIVNNHVYKNQKSINWKTAFQNAETTADKFKVLAKRIGAIELTDDEIIDGTIY